MTVSALQFSMLFGSFIAFVCAILVALRQNMKNRNQIKKQEVRIQQLETKLN